MIELKNIYENIIALLPKLALGIAVLLLFILISWLIKIVITKRIKPKTKNPLLAIFLGKIVAFIVIVIGLVFFLNIVGLGGISKQIMAGAGITTFVIGFAFKDIGENFLSGMLMAFKSPFSIGDLIETNGTIGYVSELNMRDSLIKTLDGKDVFIPNSQIIKTPLFNYTLDGFLRYEIIIGVSDTANLNQTIEKIEWILKQIPEVLQDDKKPVIIVDNQSGNTINIKILYWIDTFKSKSNTFHLNIKSQVTISLLEELKATKVSIC